MEITDNQRRRRASQLVRFFDLAWHFYSGPGRHHLQRSGADRSVWQSSRRIYSTTDRILRAAEKEGISYEAMLQRSVATFFLISMAPIEYGIGRFMHDVRCTDLLKRIPRDLDDLRDLLMVRGDEIIPPLQSDLDFHGSLFFAL